MVRLWLNQKGKDYGSSINLCACIVKEAEVPNADKFRISKNDFRESGGSTDDEEPIGGCQVASQRTAQGKV